jgi:hypothetical protein
LWRREHFDSRLFLVKTRTLLGFLAFLALACLPGCAHSPKHAPSYAPSSTAVVKAVTASKAHATALRSEVTTPAGLRTLADLHTSLDASLSEVSAYSAKVETLSLALVKAEESSRYWEAKQRKALKELWLWRIIIMAEVGVTLGYLAFRLGWKFAF